MMTWDGHDDEMAIEAAHTQQAHTTEDRLRRLGNLLREGLEDIEDITRGQHGPFAAYFWPNLPVRPADERLAALLAELQNGISRIQGA